MQAALLLLVAWMVVCQAEVKQTPLTGNECKAYIIDGIGLDVKPAGTYPPWQLSPPAFPPHCPTSYIACRGDGTGTLLEGALGELPNQKGTPVAAVYNIFVAQGVGGPSLPGAVGTTGCNCSAYYGQDAELVTACTVCQALQMSASNGTILCDARGAVNDTAFACAAPFPGDGSKHIRCTVLGPSVEPGGLAAVDPVVAQAADIAVGRAAPKKRFGIIVNQDLVDPMQEIALKIGTDEDQFLRLLGEPGQQWSYYYAFNISGYPMGQLPSDEELAQLDGLVLSGSSNKIPGEANPGNFSSSPVLPVTRKAVAAGKRVLGACTGNGLVTWAMGGIYDTLNTVGNLQTARMVFGSANVTLYPEARAATNETWVDLLPDFYFVSELHDNQIKQLGPGAIRLAGSERTLYGLTETTPAELSLYTQGPGAALGSQGHPEAPPGVPQTFLYYNQAGLEALAAAAAAGKVPGMDAQAAQILLDWINTIVARMEFSLLLWPPPAFHERIAPAFRAYMNGE